MAAPMSDVDLDVVAERVAADIANGWSIPPRFSESLDLEGALAVRVRLLHRSLDEGEQLAGWRVG